MSSDTADKILFSDWLVNLKLWLGEPFKRRISTLYTDTHTDTHHTAVELLTFTVKKGCMICV